VTGNGSNASLLRWYLDRFPADLPTAWTLSLPIMLYRGLMLLWALWLAKSLLSWLKWAWQAYSQGGLWDAGIVPAPKQDKERAPHAETARESGTQAASAPVQAEAAADSPPAAE
jgi:hypothetical protein